MKRKLDPVDAIDRFWQQYGRQLDPLDADQRARLDAYSEWLVAEAGPAGGLGPSEDDRIVERHVLDSLLFAVAAADTRHRSPSDVLDIGAGVGLPSIPLAIVWPASRVVALDRAGRRARLLRRAVRVLDLGGVDVVESDVTALSGSFELVTSRASLPPPQLRSHLERLTAPSGVGIVAGSTERAVEHEGYVTRVYDVKALDLTRWMLIMQP